MIIYNIFNLGPPCLLHMNYEYVNMYSTRRMYRFGGNGTRAYTCIHRG